MFSQLLCLEDKGKRKRKKKKKKLKKRPAKSITNQETGKLQPEVEDVPFV